MTPIFEQGSGHGIGHNLHSFIDRFERICSSHLEEGRAKSFGFVFYDFTDQVMQMLLHDQGVFAKLDRLSGRELSLFYLHSGNSRSIAEFNRHFFEKLKIDSGVRRPCVVFFRVSDGLVSDVEVTQLDSNDLIHGFSELYEVVDRYIKQAAISSQDAATRRDLVSLGEFISALVAALGPLTY
jgi:hypothetical protein